MDEGDAETNYAYFVPVKFKILPQDFFNLSRREKAVIYCFCDRYCKEEKERAKKTNRNGKRK